MKKVRYPTSIFISILTFLVLTNFILASTPVFAAEDEAIVILSTVTIQEMQQARKIIENYGGKIKNIFPPSVFIANLPSNVTSALKTQTIIKEISYKEVDPILYQDYESSTLDAIKLWNTKLAQKALPQDKTAIEAAQQLEPFFDEAVIPDDLPKTRAEKNQKEQEYIEGWKQRKQEFLLQEEEKRQEWLQKQGQLQGLIEPLLTSITQSFPSGTSETNSASNFGKAAGAGYYDTSLYMAGDIAVGVFFEAGNGGSWTEAEADDFYGRTTQALDKFINDEPNAKIVFNYKKEDRKVYGTWYPNPVPADMRAYVNNLRNTYNTHWAYMIVLNKGYDVGGAAGKAHLFGPDVKIFTDDFYDGFTVRHETMHIFGAMDQYYFNNPLLSPIARWGYLNVVNANSKYNNGTGKFSGAGEGQPDIMIGDSLNNDPIGVYTRGQVGWRDSDGDGILDPLDSTASTVIVNKTISSNQLTCTGRATEKPLINGYKGTDVAGSERWLYGNVALNIISSVEYRINQGAWVAANPQDGSFDSGAETFTFTTPALKNGNYAIEIRATNSAGNNQLSFTKDEVEILGSPVTNVKPFAAFSVNPSSSSVGANFTADASLSSDIENPISSLQVRWKDEDSGTWTGFSTGKTRAITYLTAGLKTIRCQVKDTGGLISEEAIRQVRVEVSDIPPTPKFSATPENQQNVTTTFPVTFDAAGSWDGEDLPVSLQVRWDFEDDGTWDSAYSNNLVINHNYSLTANKSEHWRARLELKDTAGNLSQATPNIWSNTYNHSPSIGNLNAAYIEGELKNTFVKNLPGLNNVTDVYVLGRYAYVTDYNSGLHIVDISDPATPILVKSLDTPGEARAVYVRGNYAYVADGISGLQIINVTDPANPILTNSFNTPHTAVNVVVSGNYAYLADWDTLQIINITDPVSPTFAGSYNTTGQLWYVDVQGNYAYIADYDKGLQIINIANPASPTFVGSYSTPTVATAVKVVGEYAYVIAKDTGLQIINITNPVSPSLVSSFTPPGDPPGASIHDVFISGNYAYFLTAAFTTGLCVVDISNPALPILAGFLDHPVHSWNFYVSDGNVYIAAGSNGLEIIYSDNVPTLIWTGNFNTQDFAYGVCVRDNYAFVADGTAGLDIIDINDPISPTLVGNYDTPGTATGVYVRDNYAFVSDGPSGLKIIDISNSISPTLVGSVDTPGTATGICLRGNYAYVADGTSGLQVIVIEDPTNPVLNVSSNQPTTNAISIYNVGQYAYIADGFGGLKIFSISKGLSLTLVGSYPASDYVSGVYVSGTRAYLAAGDQGLQVIDISTPASPTLVGSYKGDPNSKAIKVHGQGNFVYVAYWIDSFSNPAYGLQVIDISTPVSPTLVGGVNFLDKPNYEELALINGVYYYNKYVYVADGYQGLQVVAVGPHLKLSLDASDPDSGTTWDGLLEYHWDLNNDQAWDTPFTTGNTAYIPASEITSTVVCDVKDRFHATARISGQPAISYPPRLSYIGNKLVNENSNLSFQIAGLDLNNTSLTFSVTGLPAGATFVDNANNTANFSWTPSSSQVGNYSITFQVSDGTLTDSETITITVLNVNRAPLLNPIGNPTIYAGSYYGFMVDATDPDNDPITYSASNLPVGANFSTSSYAGFFEWTPTTAQIGTYSVTFTATDSYGASDSKTITISVIARSDEGETRCTTCFLAGTPILMADGSSRPIQKIKVGDKVLAFDEKTGQLKLDSVSEFFHHKADKYLIVNKTLKATEDHPVYSEGKWVEIGKLKIGDKLINAKGESVVINSIKEVKRKVDTYNLEVNPYHTYIAGGVVVHNKAKRCYWAIPAE